MPDRAQESRRIRDGSLFLLPVLFIFGTIETVENPELVVTQALALIGFRVLSY